MNKDELLHKISFVPDEVTEEDLNKLIKDTCIKFKFETHDMNNAIEPFRSYIMEAIEKQFEDWDKQQNQEK